MNTYPKKVQMTIAKIKGRNKAAYRPLDANGNWQETWYRVTVGDARRAIARGYYEPQAGIRVEVEEL